jgi:hypothetical protein
MNLNECKSKRTSRENESKCISSNEHHIVPRLMDEIKIEDLIAGDSGDGGKFGTI